MQTILCSLSFNYFYFYKNGNVSFFVSFLSKKKLSHSKVKHDPSSCRADHSDLTANDTAMAKYDFDNPIYQAEEGAEEDCELPEGLARLLKQEDRAITPYQEVVETINVVPKTTRKRSRSGPVYRPRGKTVDHVLDCVRKVNGLCARSA